MSLLYVSLAVWVFLELALRVRDRLQDRGGAARDRGTRIMIVVALAGTYVLSLLAATHVPSLRVHGAVRIVGLVVLWVGLAVRVWAIATLGRSFRTTVEVDPDQAVVSEGPYRWVRHPSYTGLLLIVIGFGLAIGNWLAFAICVAVPLPAFLRRIRVEEAELTLVLGEPYREYAAQTKRLIPGVW